jgi:hypothetical protein
MSYFDVQLGKRPGGESGQKAEQLVAEAAGPRPFFAAAVGRRPWAMAERPDEPGRPATLSLCRHASECPLCRGALEEQGGVYRCAGRCGALWLEEAAGRLVDLAALPFGICGCCQPPRALVRGDRGAVCPASAREHLLLPDGARILADTLPYGTCACCKPPMPLIQQDGLLACLARPDRRYQRLGEQLIPSAGQTDTAAVAEAIDAALRRNAARLTVNGLFDLD